MRLQTPYLRRQRGFLPFGFPDEDENVEIQDMNPSGVRPQVTWGAGRLWMARKAQMQDLIP